MRLICALMQASDTPDTDVAFDEDEDDPDYVPVPTNAKPLQVAVVGRPNSRQNRR